MRPRKRRSGRRRSRRRRLPEGPPSVSEAYELALKALGRKERTESELAGWLAERGVEDAERIEVLTRLVEDGSIDDGRFARRYAEDKRELADWGPDRIREALDARGVPAELIEAAVASESEEDIVARASAMLARSGTEVADERGRQRALAQLARRGFPLEAAYDAVRALERNG
jgi:regulatory protein